MAEIMNAAEREILRKERAAAAEAEIAEMDDIIYFGGASDGGGEVTPEEGEVQKPIDETPISDLESESPNPKEEQTPVEEKLPEKQKEEPEDEYDFSFINDMARDAIEKMAGGTSKPEQVVETPAPASVPEAQVAPLPVQTMVPGTPTQPTAIVSVEEMNEAFNSPEKMIEIMGKIYSRAKQDALAEVSQQIPAYATQASIAVAEQAKAVQEFFTEHKELAPYRDFVRYCALQVEKKHPDWNYQQVAAETAKLAKSRLPALRRAGQSKPALPGSGRAGHRPTTPAKSSGLEQEIADMPDGF